MTLPAWQPGVLAEAELEQFVADGYVVVRGAFPQSVVSPVLDWVWEKVGQDPDDPATWTEPVVHIREFLEGGPFAGVYTERLRGAIDDLLGGGRWQCPNRSGWWPVRFPGFANGEPARPDGWHVDGMYHHTLTSPNQGLLGIMMFSEIVAHGAATAIMPGSHRDVARVLAEAPDGLPLKEMGQRTNALDDRPIIELTGSPGDVALCHPFMRHSGTANYGTTPRIITNKCFPLDAPMQLERADATDYSPVEYAILSAIGQAPL
jgi:hypothetical protein